MSTAFILQHFIENSIDAFDLKFAGLTTAWCSFFAEKFLHFFFLFRHIDFLKYVWILEIQAVKDHSLIVRMLNFREINWCILFYWKITNIFQKIEQISEFIVFMLEVKIISLWSEFWNVLIHFALVDGIVFLFPD